MDKHPIQGGTEITCKLLYARETEDDFWPYGPIGPISLNATLTLLFSDPK